MKRLFAVPLVSTKLRLLVALGIVFLLCVPTFAQSDHTFQANGKSVYVGFCNELGCGSLQVAYGGTLHDPQLFLWYSVTQFRPDGYVSYYGYGNIPVDSLQGGRTGIQRLIVDTNATGVFGSACTTTWNPYSYNCVPHGGAIYLDWKQNGLYTADRLVNERTSQTGYLFHRIGRESTSSSDVTGTVFGTSVASTWGWIGAMRDTTVTITKTNQLAVAPTLDELRANVVDPATSRHHQGPRLNAADYSFSFIDYPGASRTRLFGINDQGQIVGSYVIPGAGQHGFVLSGGTFRTVEPPGAISSQARGINNAGQVTGLFTDENDNSHGFLFTNGAYQVLDYPGDAYQGRTQALGIAADGTVVGQVLADDGVFGFVLKSGVYTSLQCERAGNTQPMGVSANNVIVGVCDTDVPWSWRGFWTKNDVPQLYDVPGAAATALTGINANGYMVGSYNVEDPYAPAHGFLFNGTELLTLDVPNAGMTRLQGINASGEIVGFIDYGAHGVLGIAGNSQKPPAF